MGNDDNTGSFSSTILPREICIIPLSCENVITQGETKRLHLNKEKDIKAFETIMKDYNGVFGLGLVLNNKNDSYYSPPSTQQLKPIPICEITSYSKIDKFGIFCTIRVVSRGSILRILQHNKLSFVMKASCIEKFDTCIEKDKFDLANVLASNIENFVETLSRLEGQLVGVTSLSSSGHHTLTYTDDDDDDDNGDDNNESSFKKSFQKAFKNAKDADCQGYQMLTQQLLNSEFNKGKRTIHDLTAISWAAFSSSSSKYHQNIVKRKTNKNGSILDEKEIIVTAKVQALSSNTLLGRLHLGLMLLRHKKKVLEEELALIKNQE